MGIVKYGLVGLLLAASATATVNEETLYKGTNFFGTKRLEVKHQTGDEQLHCQYQSMLGPEGETTEWAVIDVGVLKINGQITVILGVSDESVPQNLTKVTLKGGFQDLELEGRMLDHDEGSDQFLAIMEPNGAVQTVNLLEILFDSLKYHGDAILYDGLKATVYNPIYTTEVAINVFDNCVQSLFE